jgi:hypothetical protein
MGFELGFSDKARVAARLFPAFAPQTDKTLGKTYIGTPIYDQLIFPRDGNEDVGLSEDYVLNDVIFTVTRPKNIVRTQIQGRDGDVNELINLGDHQITINGLIVSEYSQIRPAEQLREFLSIMDFKGSVAVAVGFLEIFGIDTIVIDGHDIRQTPGFYNQFEFVINARSEDPIELLIQNS